MINNKIAILLLLSLFFPKQFFGYTVTGNARVDSMRALQNADQAKALKIGFEILTNSNSNKPTLAIAYANTTIGNIFFNQGYYSLAVEYWADALDDFFVLDDSLAIGWLYVNIGNLYFKYDQLQNAEYNYNKSLQIFKDVQLPWAAATVYNNLALIRQKQNRLSLALLNFKKALEIRRAVGDPILIAHSYIYIGDLFFRLKKIEKATNYLLKAMNIGLSKPNSLNIVGRSSQLLGECYSFVKDSLSADKYFNIAENDFIKNYNASYLIDFYNKRAEISMDDNRFEQEKDYLLNALNISKNNNLIFDESKIYENLLQLPKNRISIDDSTIQQWQGELINLFKKLYDSEIKRDLKTIKLRNDLVDFKIKLGIEELEVKKANLLRNSSIVVGLLSLLLLFTIYRRYRDRRLKNAIILKQKSRFYEQHIQLEQLKTEKVKMKLESEQRELVIKATLVQRKNALITNFIDELKYQIKILKTDKPKGLQKLLSAMKKSLKTNKMLVDFEKHFTVVYPNFIEDLSRNYPELTAKELKICAYHKMNLDTKEIALIMSITVRAVQTSRYRIRKKLKIPPHVNLISFFNMNT